MKILIWICLALDISTTLFLTTALLKPNQDEAGKGMLYLPVLVLIALSIGAYYLMQNGHFGWALTASGLPVIILIYVLFISFT